MDGFSKRTWLMVGLLVALPACGRSGIHAGWAADSGPRWDMTRPLDRTAPLDKTAPDARAPDGGFPPLKQAIQACTIAASCSVGASSVGMTWPLFTPGSCLDALGQLGWYGISLSNITDSSLVALLFKCAVSADCGKVLGCLGGAWFNLSLCREGATCKGNKLVIGTNTSASFDCGAVGAKCQELGSGALRACCNKKPCGPTGVTCSGTKGEYCHPWGAYFPLDCGRTGRVCNNDPSFLCRGTGGACDAAKATTACKGAVATFCSAGRWAEHDCGANPFRSRCAVGERSRVCVPAGKQCDPAQFVGQCDGAKLKVCVDGKETLVACKDLGFTGCDLPAGAPARCTK